MRKEWKREGREKKDWYIEIKSDNGRYREKAIRMKYNRKKWELSFCVVLSVLKIKYKRNGERGMINGKRERDIEEVRNRDKDKEKVMWKKIKKRESGRFPCSVFYFAF